MNTILGWMSVGVLAVLMALGTSASAKEINAARIYKSKCKSCHGAKGEGNAKHAKKGLKIDPKLLELGSSATKSDEELLKIIAEGKGKMKAYSKKLSPEEIQAVLGYCRTLIPRKKADADAATPAPAVETPESE